MTAPQEGSVGRTKILRCTLAADDSCAYWKRVDTSRPAAKRATIAFEQPWFGTKSKARVQVLVRNMVSAKQAEPEAASHRGRIAAATSCVDWATLLRRVFSSTPSSVPAPAAGRSEH